MRYDPQFILYSFNKRDYKYEYETIYLFEKVQLAVSRTHIEIPQQGSNFQVKVKFALWGG